MSLQVWLPLTEDLENKGLADVGEIDTTHISFTDNGKIGKCLTGYTGYFDIPSMAGKKQMSVAYWVKINTATSTKWLDAFRWHSTDGSTNHSSRNEFYNDCTNTGFWFKGGSISGKDTTVEEWHHHAFTIDYEAGTAIFYIDGIPKGSSSSVNTAHYLTGTDFMIGENGLDTSHNDFRIYDHCLSEKEVKELSKGLVAHYPLNDLVIETNPNLVLNPDGSEFNGVYVSGTHYWADVGEANDRSIEQINGKSWFHCVSPTNSGYGGFYQNMTLNPTISIESDTDYTLSLDIFASTDCEFYVAIPLARPIDFTHRFNVTTSPNRYYCTFNSETIYDPSVYSFILGFYSIPQGIELYFTNVKFEKSSSPTPYEAIGYAEVGDTTIYDTSGYGHNGTVSANPPIGSIDSPRYSSCAEFNGSNNYIDLGKANWLPTDEITVSLWAYMDTWGNSRLMSCTESGGFNFEQGNGGGWRFPVFKSGTGYCYSVPAKKWASYTPGWHLITGTFDGYVSRIYIDGEFDSEATNASPTVKKAIGYNTNAKLFIGCEAASANPSSPYFNGKISDVRIYCTALSPEDIKELYEVSASIDNKGNVYAHELVES